MKRQTLPLLLLTASAIAAPAEMPGVRLMEVGDGYSSTSVNTAVFRNSAIATHGDSQYVAYYDPDGYIVLGARAIGDSIWTTNRTQYRGKVTDAHNVISIAVDGDGYIHAAFDHHDNPLRYARSVSPGSLQLGERQSMLGQGEEHVTYPEFYNLAGGDLLFVFRDGASGRGNLVMYRYDTAHKQWKPLHTNLIDGEGVRSAYWQICTDREGRIHLSWVWRETWDVSTNHDICYAYSDDNGVTWHRSDGSVYDLPITAANAEYAVRVPQRSELINQTSMAADARCRPYIATYWRDEDSEIPQYRIVYNDGTSWHTAQIGERTAPFSLSGGGTKMIPIARPRLVTDGNRAWLLLRDASRGSNVSVAYTPDISSGNWVFSDLTGFPVDAWEPNIDVSRWQRDGVLDVFVQQTFQGDGERTGNGATSTPVYVLELNPAEFSQIPDARDVLETLTLVNDTWQQTHPFTTNAFWDNAAYHTGNMEAYKLTGNPDWLDYSLQWAQHNQWQGARGTDPEQWKYARYGEGDDYVLFGDWQICFQTYADLYVIDPQPERIARASQVMEHEMSLPQHDFWWWADGLYMVMPVMTKMHNITGNPLYLDKLREYWEYADSLMYDPESRLYYRDAKYIYPKHKSANGLKDFWARGNGWVVAALAKVIAGMPADHPDRQMYIGRFRDMASAVAESMQPAGWWTRSLLDPAHAPGPETSGTAFFTYALLWGINNGILERETYLPVALCAWDYLTRTALQPDGTIGYVQPIGERAIPGQTVNAASTANFGTGAFLLAACEMYRLSSAQDENN